MKTFNERLNELQAFKAKHGHCNISQNDPLIKLLGNWVKDQRRLRKTGKLSEDRIQSLEALGFEWERNLHWNDLWEERFNEIEKFKEKNGHCNVSTQSAEAKSLAVWVANQRKSKKENKLSETRIALLDQIGFQWELRRTRGRASPRNWEKMFQKLVEVKEAYGTCNVPYGWAEDAALSRWVQRQRNAKREGELSKEQETRLNELGFEWDTTVIRWKNMFAEFTDYKNAYGHCNVPADSIENPKLARWVSTQRRHFRKGKLTSEQVQLLKSIGFE